MAFPITVDATLSSAEQPGKYGPFLIGGNRYQIILRLEAPSGGPYTANLVCEKSTDNGATWTELDAADEPVIGWNGPSQSPVPYACASDGTIIYVIFYDNINAFSKAAFDTATGLWGTAAAIPQPPTAPFAGDTGLFLYQISLVYSPFDDTLLLIVPGDSVSGLGSVSHTICAYSRYNIGSDSWGTWNDLGYQDYTDITAWDQVPCGVVVDASGNALVVMQQLTVSGPGKSQTFSEQTPGSGTFNIPDDAASSAVIEVTAAGGGPSAIDGVAAGGGGGGYTKSTIAWTPGDTESYTVGAGGLPVNDGGDSSFGGVSAGGGKKGVNAAVGGAGGAGGTASGGKGGASGASSGGGGGGAGSDAGYGQDGGDGVGPVGGSAGVPGGGSGGSNDSYGGSGLVGGGGGGDGDGVTPDPTQPTGGDGLVVATWDSVRNTHNCRMWQQSILQDDTLGTLTEITQGAYPAFPQGTVSTPPISFDITISGTKVAIAFTGATSTTGRNNIAVGQGTFSGAAVAFSFQSISSGNGGNGWDSSPCLAYGTLGLYCSYISAPTGQPVSFTYSLDSGGGFDSATVFGTLTAGSVNAGGRLQSSVLVSAPEYVWGTPTSLILDGSAPG